MASLQIGASGTIVVREDGTDTAYYISSNQTTRAGLSEAVPSFTVSDFDLTIVTGDKRFVLSTHSSPPQFSLHVGGPEGGLNIQLFDTSHNDIPFQIATHTTVQHGVYDQAKNQVRGLVPNRLPKADLEAVIAVVDPLKRLNTILSDKTWVADQIAKNVGTMPIFMRPGGAGYSKPCIDKFNYCKNMALVVYTLTVLGCGIGSLGASVATAGTASGLALAGGAVCASLAFTSFVKDNEKCHEDLGTCKD